MSRLNIPSKWRFFFQYACVCVCASLQQNRINIVIGTFLSTDSIQNFRQTSVKDKVPPREEDTEEVNAKKPRLETGDEQG